MSRTAIVTGGLSGIGLEIARVFMAEGYRVAIGARRGADPAQQDKVRESLGDDVFIAPLDVRKKGSVAAFCMAVKNRLGAAEILVNSAGIEYKEPVASHDIDAWNDMIETNLTGPFLMSRQVMPDMIEAGWGRIINIASTAAHTAKPEHAAYCASKAGLLGLTRATALEGAPHGVTCVSVSPTWVETDMLQGSAAKVAEAEGRDAVDVIAEIAQANPQKRLVQPSDIADLVAFLCSDAAPALTMEDIQVNAGALW
ncbi:MAG: SDR family oxidoreductase [Pseudomonadota bacterium]